MVKTIIVDDELKSRDILSTLLSRYCNGVNVEAGAENVASGIDVIKKFEPELVFLDISMPDGSGFDLLQQLGNVDFEVIFTTAYSEYALQALKANAVDYLLKPINIHELQLAVQKALERIAEKKNLEAARTLLSGEKQLPHPGKIAIPDNDGLRFIDIEKIIYLEARGTYTEFYCLGGLKCLSSKSLKEYEFLLPAEKFFRAHHSYIINLSHIENYHKGNGGYVTMAEGVVIDISKRKKKLFLELFHA